MEYLSEVVPRLQQIVPNYSRTFGVRIEKCCLEKHSTEVFDKYKSVSSVVLKDLSERDAKGVLQVFKKINRFAMQNMVIIEACHNGYQSSH